MESGVPRHVLTGVGFNSYNSSEILELSVKEITNPQTFDGLLHPTLGGLYDPKLGKVLFFLTDHTKLLFIFQIIISNIRFVVKFVILKNFFLIARD